MKWWIKKKLSSEFRLRLNEIKESDFRVWSHDLIWHKNIRTFSIGWLAYVLRKGAGNSLQNLFLANYCVQGRWNHGRGCPRSPKQCGDNMLLFLQEPHFKHLALFTWIEIENCFQAIEFKFESEIPLRNVTKVCTFVKTKSLTSRRRAVKILLVFSRQLNPGPPRELAGPGTNLLWGPHVIIIFKLDPSQ